MKIHKLALTNFLSYRDCVLDLSQITACSILGPNGSGKSSIAEAIIWVLFGHARLPNKELVHTGETNMAISMDFSMDENEYHVKRGYDSGTLSLTMTENGVQIASTVMQGSVALAKIVGASKELISQSIVVQQGQLSSFVMSTPTQRRDLIASMLGLDRFVTAWDIAKESLRIMNTTVLTHDHTLMVVKSELSRYPDVFTIDSTIRKLTDEITPVTASISALVIKKEQLLAQHTEARDRIVEYNAQSDDLMRQIIDSRNLFDANIIRLQQAVDNAQEQIDSRPSLEIERTDFSKELVTANQVIDVMRDLRQQITQCETAIKEARIKVSIVSGIENVCPLCGTQIEADKWRSILNNMESSMSQLISELNSYTAKMAQIPSIRTVNSISTDITTVESKLAKTYAIESSMGVLTIELDKIKQQKYVAIGMLEAKLKSTAEGISRLKEAMHIDLDLMDKELVELNNKHASLSDELIKWAGTKQARESQEKMATNTDTLLKLSKERIPETEFISAALSPAGIPLMLIDHYIPLIEEKSKEILHVISDGQMQLQLKVVEDKSKKGIDVLAGVGHLRPIRSLSGGEQTRVSLALRVALSQILHEMTNCRFDCLLIDEPEYLDEQGITQFISAVNGLRSMFPQIFVMSHLDQVKHAFNQHILVQKTDNISFADVVV